MKWWYVQYLNPNIYLNQGWGFPPARVQRLKMPKLWPKGWKVVRISTPKQIHHHHLIILLPAESFVTCWRIKFPSFMIRPALLRPRMLPWKQNTHECTITMVVIHMGWYNGKWIYMWLLVLCLHCVSKQSHEPLGWLRLHSQNRHRPLPELKIIFSSYIIF